MAAFHLINFGCRASQADGAALKRQLLEAGFHECEAVEQSQFAVLNTCTVTAVADAEVRQVIRRINRLNPDCRILVTGCYAQRAPQEIAHLPGVAWVVGNSHKHSVATLLNSEFAARPAFEYPAAIESPRDLDDLVKIAESEGAAADRAPAQVLVGEIPDIFHFVPAFPHHRTRPTLNVQDGCDARCSFCVIPQVRGPSRSLGPETVIEQVRQLHSMGYNEVVLSGINLGSYGRDLDRRINFLG